MGKKLTRLIQLRKSRKLLQKDVAEKLGVAISTYSYWESGKNEPDYESLLKLAKFFNVTTDYLLQNDNDNLKPNNIVTFGKDGVTEVIELTDEDAEKLKKIMDTFNLGKKE